MEQTARFRLKANELVPLSAKSDAAGIRRALGHLGAIAASGTALWFALGTWWAVPLTLVLALLSYVLVEQLVGHHGLLRVCYPTKRVLSRCVPR